MADLAQIGFKADTSGLLKAERGLDSLAKQGAKTDRAVSSSMAGVSKGFAGVAAAIGGLVSTTAALSKLVSVTREFDVLNAGLITATGSAKEASVAFKAIEDFATSTPYSLAQATKAFTQLVNLGLTPSEKALTSYGNTAAAMGKDLSQMVEAVADATVGEFERLKEFGIKASKQGDQVSFTFRGMTTTVKNSAYEIEGYLMSLGNNEFAGAMANRMNTLDGAISNLSDSWDAMFLTISQQGAGGVIEATVRAATDAINELTDMIASGQMSASLDAFLGKFKGFGADIAAMLGIVSGMFSDTAKMIQQDMLGVGETVSDVFFNMPENIRAALQIATVEVASWVDKIRAYMNALSDDPFALTVDMAPAFARIDEARASTISKIMDEREAALKSFDDQSAAALELRKKYDELNASIDTGVDRLAQYKVATDKAAKSSGEFVKKIKDLDGEMEEFTEAAIWLTENEHQMFESENIKEMEEELSKLNKKVDEYATISEKAAERIEAAFADAWLNVFDGFESVVDGMKNAFKRLLAEMAHMALTKPIMISLGMGGMLPGAAGAAVGGAAGGGAAGGLLGGLGIAGGLAGLGAGFTGSAALLGAGQVGTAFGLTGNLFAAGQIMTGIGAALPIIAAGAAISGVVNKISGGGLFGTSYKTTAQDLSLTLGGGDVTGLITTEESKKKSLFRGTKRRTSTESFDASSIDAAFDDIQDAIAVAAKQFGITGAEEVLKNFTASFSLSVKDKSQEEIDAAIQEWVSGTTGSMIEAVFGDAIGGLQAEGETLVDTLNRVSANMAAVESITQALGMNYGLTGQAAAEAATNIVNLAGGIGQLSALSTQYYQSFYSETERQLMLQQQLAEQFSALNVTMPDTREGFRALVDGLDLSTTAGQEMFAALMQLVPGMDQYLQSLEAQRSASEAAAEAAQKAAEAARKEAEAKAAALEQQGLSLQLRLYDALGQSAEALALRRQMELEATDETLRVMLLSIYAAEDAATAQRELAAAQEEAAREAERVAAALKDAAQDAFGKLSDSIGSAIDAQEGILQNRLDAIESERNAINELISAQDALTESLKNAAQSAFGKLEEAANREVSAAGDVLNQKLSAIDKEREALNASADAVKSSYNEQIDSAQRYADSIREISSVIDDFVGGSAAAVDPFKRLAQILSEAKAGLMPNQSELSSVLSGINSAGSAGFASAFDQARASAVAKNQALELKSVLGIQQDKADLQIEAIKQQSSEAMSYYGSQLSKLDKAAAEAQAQHDQTVATINAQIEEARKQLNVLLGIDDRALTVEQAMSEFAKAMNDANNQTIVNYDAQLAALDEQEALAISQHDATINALNAQLAEAQKQLNVLLGVDDRVLTVEQAMAEFNAAMLATQTDSIAVQVEQVAAIERVETAIIQLGEQIIEINKPEDRVWVPPTMPVSFTNEGKLVTREVLDLLKELVAGNEAIAKHTKTSADALELTQFEAAEANP